MKAIRVLLLIIVLSAVQVLARSGSSRRSSGSSRGSSRSRGSSKDSNSRSSRGSSRSSRGSRSRRSNDHHEEDHHDKSHDDHHAEPHHEAPPRVDDHHDDHHEEPHVPEPPPVDDHREQMKQDLLKDRLRERQVIERRNKEAAARQQEAHVKHSNKEVHNTDELTEEDAESINHDDSIKETGTEEQTYGRDGKPTKSFKRKTNE